MSSRVYVTRPTLTIGSHIVIGWFRRDVGAGQTEGIVEGAQQVANKESAQNKRTEEKEKNIPVHI